MGPDAKASMQIWAMAGASLRLASRRRKMLSCPSGSRLRLGVIMTETEAHGVMGSGGNSQTHTVQ